MCDQRKSGSKLRSNVRETKRKAFSCTDLTIAKIESKNLEDGDGHN
jgi:hypothetical protein